VLAVVRPTWREGTFLASLLSWSQKERQRKFALLPIDSVEADRIAAYAHERWDDLNAHLHELARMATGNVSIIVLNEVTNEVIREEIIDVGCVRKYLIGDIERALHADRGDRNPDTEDLE
jgi:hypothetical protein